MIVSRSAAQIAKPNNIDLLEARRRAADIAPAETHRASEHEPLERTKALWAADIARAKAHMAEADETLAEMLAEQQPSDAA
jgi:hypothetical protein